MSVFDKAYLLSVTGQRIEFDSVMSEVTTESNRITSHAIETGANIADHSEDAGGGLALKVVLSDDVKDPSSPSSLFSTPVSIRLTMLKELRSRGILVTYYSPRKIIPSLLIESSTESVSQSFGWGVSYDLKLTKVRLFGVVTRDVNLPVSALRLLKKGLVTAVTATISNLVRSDIL